MAVGENQWDPILDEFTTHFSTYFSGWIESDVHWGYDLAFDPWPYGYGSKLSHQGTAGFGPCVHLPGFHFGYLFLTHTHTVHVLSRRVGAGALGSHGALPRQLLHEGLAAI